MQVPSTRALRIAVLTTMSLILATAPAVLAEAVVKPYAEYEVKLSSKTKQSNPYLDVSLSATFNGPVQTIKVNGFWDGGTNYKIRMLPTEPGAWTWTISSNDPSLDGKSGRFNCVGPAAPGYVRVSKKNPHGFEWAGDGKPFFLLGDTMWHGWYDVSLADGTFQKIVDARVKQHFNYIQGVVHDYKRNEGPPVYSKRTADNRYLCDFLNPTYFQALDKKIDYMNKQGMAAGLVFAWGNEGFQDYKSPEQYKRYIKYLVARYGSKNVFWLIAGEYEEAGRDVAEWTSYFDTVAENDPYHHPTSMHTINTTDKFGSVPSQTFISHQRKGTPEYLRSLVEKSREFGKPVVNLEYGYESTTNAHRACQDADQLRMDHYALTLAGGYGIYGNAVPGFDIFHKNSGFNPNATNSTGAKQLAIMAEFFTGMDFASLVPSQQLTDNGFCACVPDSDYVVLIPTAGKVTLDLTSATGEFAVDWFDPKTGQRIPSGTTTAGAKRTFTSPNTPPAMFVTDWVLHVHKGASKQQGQKEEILGD